MKILNSNIALGIAILAISSFTGKVSAFINVVPVDVAEKKMVQVSSPTQVSASIFIYDARGNNLVSDMISPEASIKYYDFSMLPDGVYTFESYAGHMNISKEIGVKNSRVEILSKETEFKPFFMVEEETLMVSFLNQDMQDLSFSIENVEDIFYQEDEGNELTFNKKFNISELRRGEYYATLKVDGRTFYHRFNVN